MTVFPESESNPAELSAADAYDYDLPKERIAQQPLPARTDARLMLVNRQDRTIEHHHVRDLPTILQPNDVVVLNDTKVIPAKLTGYRTKTGGRWQGLFLEADESGVINLICKTRGRLEAKDTIRLQTRDGRDDVTLTLLARLGKGWAAVADTEETPLELLQRIGRVPLPHYIRGGAMDPSDQESYQTVYAEHPGSVAAPTAGLHYTDELLAELQAKGVHVCRMTLHVGLGTFTPIKTTRVEDHRMHGEWGSLPESTVARIKLAKQAGGKVIAVGSTSMRLLETAAQTGELSPWEGTTELYIKPGFSFQAVDAMMTNFHLPRTTLLVMVYTFGGRQLMQRAYEEAVQEEYRFFSYGDTMLIC